MTSSAAGDRPPTPRDPRTPTGDDGEAARLLDERRGLFAGDPSRLPEFRVSLGWLDLLVRWRRLAYTVVALAYVLAFNGIWRVGVDSALYRGLAHSLATGQGYTFAGEHHEHAYFGLPLILSLCERLFGPREWPPLLMITLMALATLWLLDRLIRLRFPLWMATLVTVGVGLNFRFVRQSQELMTDVPFALGTVATLYGLDLLRLTPWRERGATARAAALFLGGLVLSAATRPTFGVLAVALLLSSAVRAVTNRDGRRGLHVLICCAAVAVTVLLFLSDPRTKGFNPTQGVYEQELIERVQDLHDTLREQLDKFLSSNLNDAFFALKMNPVGIPAALLVLGGTIVLIRRDLCWGLMVIGLVLVTLPLSTVPRYYIMVMPLLWVGWLLLLARLTLVSPVVLRGAVMFVGVAVPLWINIGRVVGFITDQRRPDVAWLRTGADRHATFYATYRDGIVPRLAAIAQMIHDHATPTQRVVGPDGHVLTYLSDRRVVGERTIFEKVEARLTQYPAELKRFSPELAVFPSKVYDDSDRQLRDIIKRRILTPLSAPLARTGDAYLAPAEVRLPPSGVNWKSWRAPAIGATTMASGHKTSLRGLSTTQRAEALAKRERKAEAVRREANKLRKAKAEQRKQKAAKAQQQTKQAKRDRQAAQAAKDRKAHRGGATQPASHPASSPVSALVP